MHPEFAAIAVDAVVACVCGTDSEWVFTCPLQEVQACSKSVVHNLKENKNVITEIFICVNICYIYLQGQLQVFK